MAYNPEFFGSANLDAFSRLRVSEPTTIFDTQFQYGLQTLFWQSINTGGTITTLPNEASYTIATAGTGTSVLRQTYRYFRYQPGKSQLVVMTGVLDYTTASAAGVIKRLGYYDAQNGVYFQMNGTTPQVGLRTYTGGSASDNTVSQSSWNLDHMDGTGPSGITVNFALAQIFIIDLQWLGMGRVRLGLDIGGNIYYVHQFVWANAVGSTTPYMTTANLPLRCEVINTSGAGTGYALKHTCATVISEGGFDAVIGPTYSAATASAGVSAGTTITPLMSLMLSSTFGGVTNRASLVPLSYNFLCGSNPALISILYNPVLTGSPTFAVSPGGAGVVDLAASGVTGGTLVDSFWVTNNGGTKVELDEIASNVLQLGRGISGISGTPGDQNILTIAATATTGTSTMNAALTWRENY